MTSHDLVKALEVWTLQNTLNTSILLGFVAMGLVLIQPYYRALRKLLTLRVSIENWEMLTRLTTDIILTIVVIIGLAVLNPDIMADIKMAVPFVPVATILFTVALFLRLFYGGHQLGSKAFHSSLWILFTANVINLIGFSLVMEAPSSEYLDVHPSAFWSFIKSNLRSNSNLELTQLTFTICFPILIVVFLWGFSAGLKRLRDSGDTGDSNLR